MRVALAALVVLAAGCRSRSPAPERSETVKRDGRGGEVQTTEVHVADGGAIDAAMQTLLPADAMVSMLTQEAGAEPVLLVDRNGSIVATTPSGKLARTIAEAPTRRAFYDVGGRTIWFLRGGRLIAIDLTRAAIEEVVVVESMPDMAFVISPSALLDEEYCPRGCVSIRASTTPALAVVEPTFEQRMPQVERDAARRARTTEPPQFTAAGRAFFARPSLSRRQSPAYLRLSDARWPEPPSARKRPTCAYDTCGRAFMVDGLARALMVVGRTCDCKADRCSGLCVWFDMQHGRYASLRAPGIWLADVVGEPACHPEFDVSGTAYVIGDRISPGALAVCTASACRIERARFVGWLEEGFSTDGIHEDLSNCPH
ncbi:MAG: hypothetical protein ACTHU0_14785 [Kofleriaceae bacterium]